MKKIYYELSVVDELVVIMCRRYRWYQGSKKLKTMSLVSKKSH